MADDGQQPARHAGRGGNVDLYRHAISGGNGQTHAVLTAKPAEDRKFRLKVERGDKSDALESTPKAPLTTELWSASEFAKVARGARPSYRYAILGLDDTGEPEFKYLSITRSSADVLLEEEESAKKNDKDLAGALKDELHVSSDGSVAKEVGTDSVSQRLFAWGKLPDAERRGAARYVEGAGRREGRARQGQGQVPMSARTLPRRRRHGRRDGRGLQPRPAPYRP